ncbi:hypothetical protein [Rufibacter sp. XAAS-G3-1]|uniref:PepSY-like domain-containing protein n=1 Tax=Rufibacter sp. XAAS-G3-1 TaxID=2729134 RepID=UPI0015E735B5|nr:hypothetical protein [Rufibacter sp. XAAS-G3-1]
MKTTLLIIAMATGTLWSCGQRITAGQLPSLVQNSVQVKFPQAERIDWEKEGQHFEAEFVVAGVEHTVLLDSVGHVLMQKQDITAAQLPPAVSVALKRDFQAYLMDDLEQVEKQGQVYYQIELENNNEDLKRVYASNGTVVNTRFWD